MWPKYQLLLHYGYLELYLVAFHIKCTGVFSVCMLQCQIKRTLGTTVKNAFSVNTEHVLDISHMVCTFFRSFHFCQANMNKLWDGRFEMSTERFLITERTEHSPPACRPPRRERRPLGTDPNNYQPPQTHRLIPEDGFAHHDDLRQPSWHQKCLKQIWSYEACKTLVRFYHINLELW